jgi:large subunit ribosomal protein L13
MMKTFSLKAKEVTRKWYVIDADGIPLGRIASKAATILMGKHKPTYTPHIDNGDFVIIVNAGKFLLTGRKPSTKVYRHYSGYPGGMKETSFKDVMSKSPLFPLEKAIRGMLPKNKLAKKMFSKLHLFEGAEHTFKNVSLENLEV